MPATPETSTDIAAWRGLVRVQGAVRRELDTALRASEGISLWDYTVLRTLAATQGGCLRMTELARATDYTPSGLTRLADRLERAGLVRREPCPDDGRGSVATLTVEGRKAFARARRTHLAEVRQRFLERFDERELAQMAAFWERLLPGSTT
jgi:DNA-binding MarR family transcriptional regulator